LFRDTELSCWWAKASGGEVELSNSPGRPDCIGGDPQCFSDLGVGCVVVGPSEDLPLPEWQLSDHLEDDVKVLELVEVGVGALQDGRASDFDVVNGLFDRSDPAAVDA
jgi:hypothetical protein